MEAKEFAECFQHLVFYENSELLSYLLDYFLSHGETRESLGVLLHSFFETPYYQAEKDQYDCYQLAAINSYYHFFSFCRYFNISYTIKNYFDITAPSFNRYWVRREESPARLSQCQYLQDFHLKKARMDTLVDTVG